LSFLPVPTTLTATSTTNASLFSNFRLRGDIITGIEESGNGALIKAAKDLVAAEDHQSVPAENAAVTKAKNVCYSLER